MKIGKRLFIFGWRKEFKFAKYNFGGYMKRTCYVIPFLQIDIFHL